MSISPKVKKDNGKGKRLTILQKNAQDLLLANGGIRGAIKSGADLLRKAGFAESMARNPQKVFQSKGFAAVLDKAGLTDSFLAKKHAQLANASILEEKIFHSLKIGYKTIGKGKKKKEVATYRKFSDEFIKLTIEGPAEAPTGCIVLTITEDPYQHARIAHFRRPDNVVQGRSLELGYKTKGLMAPDRLDLVSHALSEEEDSLLGSIFSGNKK
jgi:hypothetical protein